MAGRVIKIEIEIPEVPVRVTSKRSKKVKKVAKKKAKKTALKKTKKGAVKKAAKKKPRR